jgi:hypothetical protein
MRRMIGKLAWAAPLVAVAAAAACSGDATGGTTSPTPRDGVGLSFAVPQTAKFDRVADTGPGGHTLDLSEVQMVVARIRMRLSDQTEPGCAGPNEQHPCLDFSSGPSLVDLPIHGGLVTPVISKTIPPGSYRFILVNILPPSGDDSTSKAFRAANNWPKLAGMRVKGTYDGQAFDIFLNVNAEIYNKLDPPFVVTADKTQPLNVTIAIDPHAWFKTGDGTLIDPRALTADKSMLELVTGNIRNSFHAFSDNQRHGGGS